MAEPPIDAILDAMRTALASATPGDPGLTTDEFATKLGVSVWTMKRHLRRLHAEGRLIVGRRVRLCFNGQMRPHTVYRVKDEKWPEVGM